MTEMKKYAHYTHWLLPAAALLLLSACTAEEPAGLPGEPWDTTERPLTVTAQLEAAVETRAATALQEGTLAVFRKTTNEYAALSNIPYTWDAGTTSWKSADAADKNKTVYVDHRNAEVYAYYPYNASQGSNTVFSLTMGKNTPSATMLYSATQTVNNRTALATFAMKSGYARISFRILNKNLPYCLIRSAAIAFGSAVKTQGTLDISAATPTVSLGAATATNYAFPLSDTDSIYKTGIGTGRWDETLDLLMLPGQGVPAMTFTVKLKLNGMLSEATTTVTIPAGAISGNLVQGKQYIIPLMVKGTTISFASASVPGMGANTDKDSYGEDMLTAYTLPPVTLDTDLQVATGNLFYYVSKLISESQNPNYALDGVNNWYCFAARDGYRWAEQTPTYQFGAIPSQDLCERVGDNWTLPTAAQLQKLTTLTKTAGTCNDSGKGSQSGCWIGSYNAGQGFYQKSAIFLTNGNYLAGDGGYLTVSGATLTFTASGTAAGSFIRCMVKQ